MSNRLSDLHARLRGLEGERGQTAVEYGLLVSLVALLVVAILALMGQGIADLFFYAGNSISG